MYLNGTSWFTSVWPLMMRFSATFTRRVLGATALATAVGRAAVFVTDEAAIGFIAGTALCS